MHYHAGEAEIGGEGERMNQSHSDLSLSVLPLSNFDGMDWCSSHQGRSVMKDGNLEWEKGEKEKGERKT